MADDSRPLGARSLAVLALFVCCACPPKPQPEPPDPPPVDPNDDRPACVRACARLSELDCPEAEPSPDGKPCDAWLCNAVDSGIVDLDPECLASIDSCADVDGRCRD